MDNNITIKTTTGREFFLYERALSQMLAEPGLLAVQDRSVSFEGCCAVKTTTIWVNCNDLFAQGCADAEPLLKDEIWTLHSAHFGDPRHGAAKWCCRRRNQRPCRAVEQKMRDDGAWDETIEALPANTQTAEFQHLAAELADALQIPEELQPSEWIEAGPRP